jgi:phosphoribosylformimino-5-aminoimidazole carboxamide ribotide isomerase
MCGFRELYVADLDALLGKGNNLQVLKEIAEKTGLELMVDAGIADMTKTQEVLQSGVSRVIIGTETLSNLNFVKDAIARFGSEKVVVSLDLMNGQVLSKSEQTKRMSPLMLTGELEKRGVAQMVVLDLARVGSGEGVDLPFLKELLEKVNAKVLVGGGVRGIQDLVTLKKMGVSGVLLATALHSGRISVDALQQETLL